MWGTCYILSKLDIFECQNLKFKTSLKFCKFKVGFKTKHTEELFFLQILSWNFTLLWIWKSFKILGSESNKFILELKRSLFIIKNKPSLTKTMFIRNWNHSSPTFLIIYFISCLLSLITFGKMMWFLMRLIIIEFYLLLWFNLKMDIMRSNSLFLNIDNWWICVKST